MSMEHKAYIFDTNSFKKELSEIIINCGNMKNLEALNTFIRDNISRVKSPYTGELLDNEWEKELETGEIQELADFALTCYYSPEEDMGISYAWDELLTSLSTLPLKFNSNYYVLGRTLQTEKFILDPGGMGLGFVYAEDIPIMYNELINLSQVFKKMSLDIVNSVTYDVTFSELMDSYKELIALYKQAMEINYGLLMTF